MVFNLIITIIWAISNIRRQLLYSYWFETKEYRLDRLFSFAKTSEGFQKLELPALLIKLATSFTFPTIYLLILLYETLLLVCEITTKQIKRQNFSIRGKNFLLTSLTFIALGLTSQLVSFSADRIILFDLISYSIPLIALSWTQILFNRSLNKELVKAKKKLSIHKPIIISITGSQGKSSTKHILHHILKSHFKTEKTPLSHNTPFGIIRAVNSQVNKKTKIFISEMGAYKKGEIKFLTTITKPNIAVITGISPQHIDLFGSMQNLLEAKYEIVQNECPLFINTTTSSTLPILKRAKRDNIHTFTYALNKKADFWSKTVKRSSSFTKLMFHTQQTHYFVNTNLTFEPLLQNLTAALAISTYLKVPKNKIVNTARNIPEIERSLVEVKISKNITILNDSYNSTVPGFETATKLLSQKKGKKIIITTGILELGKISDKIHKELASKIKDVDTVMVTNKSLINPFQSSVKNTNILYINNFNSNKILINAIPTKQKVYILVEGRIPSKIMNNIYSLK